MTLLGGYPGAEASDYAVGRGGVFQIRDLDPEATRISGGSNAAGVTFTRFNENPYHGRLDNLRVTQSRKGVVCDTQVSWPHPDNLILTHILVDQNGQVGEVTRGAGILVCGSGMQILDSQVRDNHGGRGAGISGQAQGLLIQDSRIEDNICYDDHGGGIYLAGTAHLTRNRISGNRVELGYGWGGGLLVFNAGSSASLEQNLIRGNYAPSYGGGVFIDEGAAVQMQNDLVVHNTTKEGIGGGVALDDGTPGPSHLDMRNCTVAYNTAGVNGGPSSRGGNGIFIDNDLFADIRDSLFWGNGDDFYVREGSDLTLTWSLSQEVWPSVGNRSANPLFADPAADDFHLRSQIGRYLPSQGSWVVDTQQSPAIDAGDPASPFGAEPQPNGGRVNIGAFGNTAEASLGGVPAALPDFIVTNLVLTPATPKAGKTFSAAVTVRNQGSGAGVPQQLQVWTDQAGAPNCGALGDAAKTLTSLAAGASRTLTFTGLRAPGAGTRSLMTFVDAGCQTVESNETNNQLAKIYQVLAAPAPDFTITRILLTPEAPRANRTFRARVTVKNQGTAAGLSGALLVWTNQSMHQACGAASDKSIAVGRLARGASRTLTVTGLPAGSAQSKTFRAFIDGRCVTSESNEDNNQATRGYQMVP